MVKANTKKSKFTVKRVIIGVLILGYLVGIGYLFVNYMKLAPKRATSSFLNDIIKANNLPAAYKITAPGYQQNIPFASFYGFFHGLAASNIKYTVSEQQVTGNAAVTAGYLEDYQGANYVYIFHLQKVSGHWLIDSTFHFKE